MKIVSLIGSPRPDGNSTQIAKRFIETAKILGAEIRTFPLNRMTYRGCQGCCACKTGHDACVLGDDLTEALAAIKEADVLMVSSPIYYGDIPGQVKSFIDRTFSYMVPDYIANPKCSRLASGKKLVLIFTQGAPDEKMFAEVPKRYGDILNRVLASGEVRLIRACGVGAGGVPKDVPEKALRQAEEIARGLLSKP